MIKSIKIEAFKSILNLEFNCSKLNFIIGTNSSGKSTALQTIRLFAESHHFYSSSPSEMNMLGNFRELRNFNSTVDKILFQFVWINDVSKLTIQEVDNGLLGVDLHSELKDSSTCDWLNSQLHYLSCQRIGHQSIYQKNKSSLDNIDYLGNYTMHHFHNHKKDNLEEGLIKDTEQLTLDYQVNYWLNYIVGASISTEDINPDYLNAFYTIVEGKPMRPINVGSGIGYIISVIVMCLASKKNDIIIIENPEIHLHPLAQSKVCEFLYFIANSGRQLFIETHSDHLFNGIRAGIATNIMNSDDISVQFFSLDEKNCTVNTKIEFGKRGRILNPKKDLFDQFDFDLNRMLGL